MPTPRKQPNSILSTSTRSPMQFLAELSRDEAFANTLAVLRQVVASEFKSFRLTLLTACDLPPGKFQVTGFCDPNYCPVYRAEEMLHPTDNFPILSGHFIEVWKGNPEPRIIRCAECPELFQQELQYFGEAIVIPIWMQGKVERWVVIVDYQFTQEKIDLIKISLALNYALSNILRAEQKRQLDKARQWIDAELDEISRLQSLLLPEPDIEIPGIQVAFSFKAYKSAGGDYLDVFSLPGTDPQNKIYRWGCMIADVTGHGPSAAVEAAMIDAILRTFRGNENATPADAAHYLNENFFTRRDRGKFATANLISYQSIRGSIRYVSAGHPYPYIKRGNQLIILDKSQGIPIGVKADYHWEYAEFKVQPGDLLFLYTDVVLETRDHKQQEFGQQRLEALLKNLEPCPQKIIDGVEKALMDYSGNALKDDLTICAIKILG